MITLDQLKAITNQKESILIPFVTPLNDTLKQFAIDTPIKQAYFLAQICHESGCFRYTEEIASGDAYDTRVDLGNTPQIDGDGRTFKGRGLIQLTGKTNYKKLSDYFKNDFVANPKLLKEPNWACKSAGWFWKTKGLNEISETNDFLKVTFLINGGFNGLEDRLKYLVKIYRALGLVGLAKQMDNFSLEVSFNIDSPKDTRFRKLLNKVIPDKASLALLMKKLQTL